MKQIDTVRLARRPRVLPGLPRADGVPHPAAPEPQPALLPPATPKLSPISEVGVQGRRFAAARRGPGKYNNFQPALNIHLGIETSNYII